MFCFNLFFSTCILLRKMDKMEVIKKVENRISEKSGIFFFTIFNVLVRQKQTIKKQKKKPNNQTKRNKQKWKQKQRNHVPTKTKNSCLGYLKETEMNHKQTCIGFIDKMVDVLLSQGVDISTGTMLYCWDSAVLSRTPGENSRKVSVLHEIGIGPMLSK